jgi:glycosyltransferase involved in cell wall biosynthesis
MNTTKPTLHVIGLFHTICNHDYDHCAFTGKVMRFGKMMRAQGYKVIEYSNDISISEVDEHVSILPKAELLSYTKTHDTVKSGNNAIGTPHWTEFDKKLKKEMATRIKSGDIVCHPFGPAHIDLLTMFPEAFHVETGIGYPNGDFGAFRIFETYAWMHYHQGLDRRPGKDYEWVVPNFYDLEDWEPNYEPGKYLLYFGRVVPEKGLEIVQEIAKHLNEPIRIVGNGDLESFVGKNMIIEGPITGVKERSDLLRNAKAVFMPTRFTEPFGGAGVEAMLCGTPLISSNFGAFTETVEDGKTGFRCHTLGDYLEAIKQIDTIDRKYVADRARALYNTERVGKMYDKIFMQIADLKNTGWYTLESRHLDPRPFDLDNLIEAIEIEKHE